MRDYKQHNAITYWDKAKYGYHPRYGYEYNRLPHNMTCTDHIIKDIIQ